MKKNILKLFAILAIFTLSKCNTKEEKKQPASASTEASDKCKGDYTFYSEKNSYLNLDISKLYVNKEDEKSKLWILFDPHDKGDFRRDSTTFDTTYISKNRLLKSASFPLYIADMYSMMQSKLDITQRAEYDADGNETINGMRVYPAIATEMPGGNKVLYMVFMGEEELYSKARTWEKRTMLDSTWYAIRDGRFVELTAAEKTQARLDIISYQNYWNTEFPPTGPVTTPIGNPNVNLSFSSSINRYYELLNGANLAIYPGRLNATLKYGIVFYPCIENNKLIFVLKGFAEDNTGTRIPFEGKYFYDNMDVCPTKCPVNPIQ